MSRRRSQSVQKPQKWQSVRPSVLDGLDGLLTTLVARAIIRKVLEMARRTTSVKFFFFFKKKKKQTDTSGLAGRGG